MSHRFILIRIIMPVIWQILISTSVWKPADGLAIVCIGYTERFPYEVSLYILPACCSRKKNSLSEHKFVTEIQNLCIICLHPHTLGLHWLDHWAQMPDTKTCWVWLETMVRVTESWPQQKREVECKCNPKCLKTTTIAPLCESILGNRPVPQNEDIMFISWYSCYLLVCQSTLII